MPSSDPVINFPCHCGYRFSLPADQAASVIQCPRCRRLNDVPTLSDLLNLSEDGTVLLKAAVERPAGPRVDVVDNAYRPNRYDAQGNEIDLRVTHDDLANIGAPPEADEIPLAGESVKPSKPKYDPVTGDLIRPVQLAKSPDLVAPQDVPVAKRAGSLTYAAGDLQQTMTPRRILVELFMPTNAAVMGFVFAFYIFFQIIEMLGAVIFVRAGLPASVANLPLAFILMAHYVNTIEDNGPEAIDELPRPMRSLSWPDDLWGPFSQMATAFMYCFVPLIICLKYLPPQLMLLSALPLGLGIFFFPAALLTAATSGSIVNLRPDRVMGVIRVTGNQYLLALAVWSFALPLFAFSFGGVNLIPISFREAHERIYWLNKPVIAYPLLFVSIILMHFASWHLGLIYRRYHDQFPWAMQKHVSQRRQKEAEKAAEIRAMRRKPRYVQNVPSRAPTQKH